MSVSSTFHCIDWSTRSARPAGAHLKGIVTLLLVGFCLWHIDLRAAEKAVPEYDSEVIASGLNHPWSLAFLPDGQLLVTERNGNLMLVSQDSTVTPVGGIPADLYAKGQGGLLDVVLHPDYAINGWIYLSYTAGSDDFNTLKVERARLERGALVDTELVLLVEPKRDTPVHYGARMAFLDDHSLLVTSGDGFDYREDAQRINNHLGKILRVREDGGLLANNPFFRHEDKPQARAVFSLGHRNPQGLVYDSVRRLIFAHEHGPDGGDELNIIHPGNNYGWPVVTNGRDYSGASISPFRDYPGMELPLFDWTPSIAPSGLVAYYGSMFPALRGDLLLGSLKFKDVRWLQMDGNEVASQVSLFSEFNRRMRDIRVHPDGSLFLLTDEEDGQILRIFAPPATK